MNYQPDLFGGEGRSRPEPTTRAQNLSQARAEMMDTNSDTLFDAVIRIDQFGVQHNIASQSGLYYKGSWMSTYRGAPHSSARCANCGRSREDHLRRADPRMKLLNCPESPYSAHCEGAQCEGCTMAFCECDCHLEYHL